MLKQEVYIALYKAAAPKLKPHAPHPAPQEPAEVSPLLQHPTLCHACQQAPRDKPALNPTEPGFRSVMLKTAAVAGDHIRRIS